MKYLITTIAAVALVGCGESQQTTPSSEVKPIERVAEVPAQPPTLSETQPAEQDTEAEKSEPQQAKAHDISIHGVDGKGNIQPLMVSPIKRDYYCLSCKKTENISAYRQDFPDNWKEYPGGENDSILYCIKCKKGRAHPVSECKTCSTVFILHLLSKYDQYGDHSCPKCDVAYGQAAKDKGFDLIPIELNPSSSTPPQTRRQDG